MYEKLNLEKNNTLMVGDDASDIIAAHNNGLRSVAILDGYGDVNTIPHNKPEIAAAFALAAQYMGMKLVYLEGGSGSDKPVPDKVVSIVRKTVNIPIIVGGGIRTGAVAAEKVKAGANIIVTGTATEKGNVETKIKEIVDAIRKAGK